MGILLKQYAKLTKVFNSQPKGKWLKQVTRIKSYKSMMGENANMGRVESLKAMYIVLYSFK